MIPLPPLPEALDLQDLMLTLLSPWDDARSMVLQAVQAATTTIYVADYSLTMPDLVTLLVAKARAGVRVKIVLDHSQSAGAAEHPLVLALLADAAQTEMLSVVITTSPVHGAITHVKVIVVDGWLALDGSFNFSGRDETSGAEAEVNDLNVIPSRKRAQLFMGHISWLADWALVHEPRYQQGIPASAVIGTAQPPDPAPPTA